MIIRKPTFLLMICLVILLGVVLIIAGSCASKKSKLLKKKQHDVLQSYRLHISKAIDDPQRAEQLILLGEGLYYQFRAYTETLQKMEEKLYIMNGEYETTREELKAGLKAINDHRRNIREKILAARDRALSLTTPEEWQGLMSRSRTLLDLIRETPGIL